MEKIGLKKGREKSVLQKHPWIFSGAIESVSGEPEIGETVAIYASNGQFLAWAAYSPFSQIRARIWSWNLTDEIDRSFLREKINQAVRLRKELGLEKVTNSFRLIHGESDGLPGLIVDQYDNHLVIQYLSAGSERFREVINEELLNICHLENLYERSDLEVRKLEGLPLKTGLINGNVPEKLEVIEYGQKFEVDIVLGQKTGFYLDQRDNRHFIQSLVKNKEVLNGFCFTGGFTVHALAGLASTVCSLDSSADAIEKAKENVRLNDYPMEKCSWIVGDAFQELRKMRDRAEQFDVIILDPPKFAPTAAQVARAARGYKDINLLAFKLLRNGGTLVTFSCSGGVSSELFQKIVADAALDADVQAKIVYRLSQGPDHPVSLNFPEGTYLKGLVCQVIK
ncbi:MAG: class I SAM-dependent rRNA methyltransferase [Anaerolineaceae bacterium]